MKKWLVFALVGLLAAACGPSNTGQLAFTVLGVPAGVTVSLEVSGPDGFKRTVTDGKALTGLAAGEYEVRASDIERTGQNALKADVRYSKTSEGGKARVEPTGITTATLDYNVARLSVNVSATAPTPTVRLLRGNEVFRTFTATQTLVVPPGQYTLEATNPPAGSSYEVVLDRTALTLAAGDAISANVVYSQGFGDFSLNLTLPPGQTALTPPAVLQGEGSVRFEVSSTRTLRLPVGRYTLSASPVVLEQVSFAPTLSGTTFDLVKDGSLSASVTYAATNSLVSVNVTGALGTDTVTVRLTPAAGQPTVRTQTGNGTQSFVVPFGTYTVDASAPRAGTYVDGVVAFRGSVTTSVASFNQPVSAALVSSPFSGALLAVGNGGNNNRGWNTQFGDVAGLRRDTDVGVSVVDANIAAGATPVLFTALGTTLPAGHLRGEGLARVAFDAGGNLYALYQRIPARVSDIRVIRISRENLLTSPPSLDESAAGNKRIEATSGVSGRDFGLSDMAFDAAGNLWLLNTGLTVSCVSAAQLTSSASSISTASQTLTLPNSTTALGNYGNLYAFKFDLSGNLWIASGDYRREGGAPLSLTRLSRIPASRLTCTSANSGETTPDVRLSIALTESPTSSASTVPVIHKPYAVALSPDGNALWVADYGAGSDITASGCPSGSNQTNYIRESVIKVPLNTANTTPNPAGELIRNAVVTARLTIGEANTTAPEKGLQQPTDLAFDKQGRLWVATDNNVEIDSSNPCYATTTVDGLGPFSSLVTDQRGKLYSIAPGELGDTPSPTSPIQLRPVTSFFTINSPSLGQGFTGIAFGN
ncbi:MAG: hypothetical protein SFU83_05485 [Meiothermus sp.]|nr:hypothetical protein [Meiothermus sp.]